MVEEKQRTGVVKLFEVLESFARRTYDEKAPAPMWRVWLNSPRAMARGDKGIGDLVQARTSHEARVTAKQKWDAVEASAYGDLPIPDEARLVVISVKKIPSTKVLHRKFS